MSTYMYLFRGGDAADKEQSPEQMQAHMQKWMVWIKDLSEKGLYLGGEPLHKAGTVVAGAEKLVTDGPFAEGKELVGGYFLIKTDSMETAVELSKDAPLLENGGSVEVREIMQM